MRCRPSSFASAALLFAPFALAVPTAALPAQELPPVEVRSGPGPSRLAGPGAELRYAVQMPPRWTPGTWAPLVLAFAAAPGDDAARAAVARLGTELPQAGFVVVAVAADGSTQRGIGRLLAELRRTFRIEQGGMHAAVDGDPRDAQAVLLANRHEFQTVTAFGEGPHADLAAVRRLPARRVHELDTSDPKALAAHFTKLHGERVLPGVAGEAARALDDFHDAAANADPARYFAILPDDAVFLGTDGTERWTGEQFRREHAKYFTGRASAWTYVALRRHVTVEPGGQLAWFDETFDNEAYGECRGSGVLARREDRWVLRQYHLTVPVPNELARDLALRVRALQAGVPAPVTTIVVVRHAEKVDDGTDPPLSTAGVARAEALARALRDLPVAAVYTSPFRRTAATVAPLCAARGLGPTTVTAADARGLAARLREHAGQTVVVCGHSNTVPDILRALGIAEAPAIADHEYDRLFVVTLGNGDPSLLSLRY